jgi:hypothetical protein
MFIGIEKLQKKTLKPEMLQLSKTCRIFSGPKMRSQVVTMQNLEFLYNIPTGLFQIFNILEGF